MGPPTASNEIEALWRIRLQQAQSRLDLIRRHLKDVQQDYPINDPPPDAQSAYQRAIDLERLALQEYHLTLQIFTDFVMDGKQPDEAAWQRRMAPGAGLM